MQLSPPDDERRHWRAAGGEISVVLCVVQRGSREGEGLLGFVVLVSPALLCRFQSARSWLSTRSTGRQLSVLAGPKSLKEVSGRPPGE